VHTPQLQPVTRTCWLRQLAYSATYLLRTLVSYKILISFEIFYLPSKFACGFQIHLYILHIGINYKELNILFFLASVTVLNETISKAHTQTMSKDNHINFTNKHSDTTAKKLQSDTENCLNIKFELSLL